MSAAMIWLLVALCAISVNSLPVEVEEEQQSILNKELRSEIEQAIQRWRLKSGPSKPENVETSSDISEAENLFPSDQDITPWKQREVDAPVRQRRFFGALATVVFKTVATAVIRHTSNYLLDKFKDKRDLTDVKSLPDSSDKNVSDDGDQFVSEAVENAVAEADVEQSIEAATPKNLQNLLTEKVIKVEKFELPLMNVDKWFKNKHDGIVVTLANGRRLLILKGYEFSQDKSTVVLDAKVMTDTWNLLESRTTSGTLTLGDYVKTNEDSSSSLNAAKTMMALD